MKKIYVFMSLKLLLPARTHPTDDLQQIIICEYMICYSYFMKNNLNRKILASLFILNTFTI